MSRPIGQLLRNLGALEFAESSYGSPGTARSSTCVARCRSATASVVVGTSRPISPGADWMPTADHYPMLKMHGGRLTPDNVRLAHQVCNQRDYLWRVRINAMLGKRMSLEKIAEQLNAEGSNDSRHEQMDACFCPEGVRFLSLSQEPQPARDEEVSAPRGLVPIPLAHTDLSSLAASAWLRGRHVGQR